MRAKKTPNLEMLAIVAKGLKHLKEKVVFVGGATIDLYLSDQAAEPARATDDVDCVVSLIQRSTYHNLEEELRKLGFQHPMGERAPMCRWNYHGIKVDVMPTEGKVLGFSNQWYPDGVAHAESIELHDGQTISIFPLPFLLASKLEAFNDRGRKDFLASSDIEDILTVIDGCENVKGKISQSSKEVISYLANQFKNISTNPNFTEAVLGHFREPERATRATTILREIAEAS